MTKYAKHEEEIEDILNLIGHAENREPQMIDLQKILNFIFHETGGLFKFLKARVIYKEKRLYMQGKGLAYFLAICKNQTLGARQHGQENFPQGDNGSNKPAGREV
jgi:hypothetical protein